MIAQINFMKHLVINNCLMNMWNVEKENYYYYIYDVITSRKKKKKPNITTYILHRVSRQETPLR